MFPPRAAEDVGRAVELPGRVVGGVWFRTRFGPCPVGRGDADGVGRESGLLLHRCDGVAWNIGQQVRDVQALVLGGGDRADRRREPGVLDDLSGQIGCVVPGLGDQVGDPAQVLLVDILGGPGLGGIEEVRRIRGGVVDELQVRDRQVGQHLTDVDAVLLQLFDPVGDVGHRCGVRDSLGEVGSIGPGIDE